MIISGDSANFGDIHRRDITIDGTNVNSSVTLVEIFQDIYTPAWSCHLTFQDSSNLMMNLPIKPGSEVSITIETKETGALDGERTFNFIIYKIGDKSQQGQMHQQFILYCITPNMLINQSVRVSKSFSNMKPEEAVQEIVGTFLGGSLDKKDDSDISYHIIVPNWSPFTAIAWFTKVALIGETSDFVFFLKDDDAYWFRSINEMYGSDKTGVVLSQHPSGLRDSGGDPEVDYSLMVTKYAFEHYDGLGNMGSGMYKNKISSFDMISKQWTTQVFTYGQDIGDDDVNKGWEGTLLEPGDDAHVSFMPIHNGANEKAAVVGDNAAQWHTSRKTNLMKLEQDKLTIQIPGGILVSDWLGLTTDVDLPSQQDFDEGEDFDKYYKGEYLITHIYHHLTANYHTVNMECIKRRLAEKM